MYALFQIVFGALLVAGMYFMIIGIRQQKRSLIIFGILLLVPIMLALAIAFFFS